MYFSALKFPFGSSLYRVCFFGWDFLFAKQFFVCFKCVCNCLFEHLFLFFMMDVWKSLSDISDIFVILILGIHWFSVFQSVWCFLDSWYQFSSVAQSCPTLCDPMNHSTPGVPVHYQLLEFTQTHVHRVSDAIQPSHPLSSPSLPAPNPSQHQSLFQWVNSSHEVTKVLEFQL